MQISSQELNSRYKMVPRTLVFIEKDDEILLINRKKKKSFGFGKLNGIGGHIEKGEEPFESAKREILEETGLIVDTLDLVALIFIEIGIDPGILLFVFRTKYPGGELISADEGDLNWVQKSAISSINNIVKDIPFLLNLCNAHQKGEPPIFGKYLYDENNELRIVMNSWI
jgi:8-oxo-dGTP diphosphatase